MQNRCFVRNKRGFNCFLVVDFDGKMTGIINGVDVIL